MQFLSHTERMQVLQSHKWPMAAARAAQMENVILVTGRSSRQRRSSRARGWDCSESGKSWGDRVTSLAPPFSKGVTRQKPWE